MQWAIFVAAAMTTVAAGIVLALSADVLSRRIRLGSLWFGAVVVALVTSLPELVTSVAAVRQDAPALALGDLFGSCMANMAILGFVTLLFRSRRLIQRAALEHILSGALSISLLATALLFLSSDGHGAIGNIGVGPLVIAIAYLVGTYAAQERQAAVEAEESQEPPWNLTSSLAVRLFVFAAVVILVSGPFLASSSNHLADQTGLGETFFGTFSLALITSLPELTVAISAIRIGAFNLAIGNLLGSNATNMALILPLDLAYSHGPIFATAAAELHVAAAGAILLTAIGISGIVIKAERRRFPLDVTAVLIIGAYLVTLWSIYEARPV